MASDLFGEMIVQRRSFALDGAIVVDQLPPPEKIGGYRTISADPPWLERGGGKIKRGADRHYALMPTADIAALPVHEWAAEQSHLYLWVTNNFLPDGLIVMRAWGFRYVTKIDWFKGDVDDEQPVEQMDDADLQIGLGQYFRGVTESCLFGVRGDVEWRSRPGGKREQGRTGFHAPRTAHSAKPAYVRQVAERVSHGPRLEMFARARFDGWDAWGLEAT